MFSSLVALKLLCFLGRTNQAFPIICSRISCDYEMHFINRANKTLEVKSLLSGEIYLINYIIIVILFT